MIREYEDDIVIDGDEGDSSADDFFADEAEYSLRSLGVSAAEMRHVLLSAPAPATEWAAVEAMAEMMSNLGAMRSSWFCEGKPSGMTLLCGQGGGVLGEEPAKVIRGALGRF